MKSKSIAGKLWGRVVALAELPVMALCSLYPRDKSLMIFGAWDAKRYDDNPRYLFEYAHSQGENCVWLTQEDEVFRMLTEKGLPVCKSDSFKARLLALKAGCVVYNVSAVDIGPKLQKYTCGAMHVNLWHGIPLKKIGLDDVHEARSGFYPWIERVRKQLFRKTYFVATSGYTKELYQRCFGLPEGHVVALGQTRNDCFYHGCDSCIRTHFPGKKIVIYLPTHRQYGKIPIDLNALLDTPEVDRILRSHNAVILVKKHNYHLAEPISSFKSENIVELRDLSLPVQELLHGADILMTDYSGCFTDYLLLDRPILFYAYDLEDYLKEDRDLYFDYRTIAPGPVCTDVSGMTQMLEKMLSNEDEFKDKRRSLRNMYYSADNQQAVAAKQLNWILSRL